MAASSKDRIQFSVATEHELAAVVMEYGTIALKAKSFGDYGTSAGGVAYTVLRVSDLELDLDEC